MHTPDGFLTSWICIAMALASVIPVALALNNLRREMTKDRAVRIASVAAVIFASQMLNFPIGGGTSGHLIGAAFAFAVLGLDGAVLAVSSVLVLQALVFGDGGILALGANIFNMAIVGVYAARFAYERWGAFASSWASVFLASLSCGALLVLGGSPLEALPAMGWTHAIIGIGEGLATIALLELLRKNPATLSHQFGRVCLALSFLGLAILLPFASGEPDGLERIAIDFGFYGNAVTVYEAPIPDYAFRGAGEGIAPAIAMGLFGTFAAFTCAYAAARLSALQLSI